MHQQLHVYRLFSVISIACMHGKVECGTTFSLVPDLCYRDPVCTLIMSILLLDGLGNVGNLLIQNQILWVLVYWFSVSCSLGIYLG